VTEGRVARPERRWDCHRGTPLINYTQVSTIHHHTASVTPYLASQVTTGEILINYIQVSTIHHHTASVTPYLASQVTTGEILINYTQER